MTKNEMINKLLNEHHVELLDSKDDILLHKDSVIEGQQIVPSQFAELL